MKKILAIAWKDTLVRFTCWAEWIFFLVLPVIFTVILAGGTGGIPGTIIGALIIGVLQMVWICWAYHPIGRTL
jgi:branched-subunit amino acid ABC-type transport system permease component